MLSGTLVRPRGVLKALRAQRAERQVLRRAWWHKRSIITHGSRSHTRQQRDVILTTPPPARGCEERCRDRVQPNRLPGARPRNAARRSGRLPNPSNNNNNDCHTLMQRCSCALICISVTDQRVASRVLSRPPAGDGRSVDPAERDDSRHVGTPLLIKDPVTQAK